MKLDPKKRQTVVFYKSGDGRVYIYKPRNYTKREVSSTYTPHSRTNRQLSIKSYPRLYRALRNVYETVNLPIPSDLI